MSTEEFFVESDNDCPVVVSVGAALNKFGELEVEMEKTRHTGRRKEEKTVATLDREETRELARRLGVEPEGLSGALREHFEDGGLPFSPGDVERLFGETLDFLLDNGARYRLRRE